MTEDDLIHLLCTQSARHVLDTLAQRPQVERRKHAKAVMKLYKLVESRRFSSKPIDGPKVKDEEAVTIGLLATATLTDLKKLSYFPHFGKVSLCDAVAALQPDWTQGLVDHLVESSAHFVGRVAPLWKAGFCDRPESDAIILGYYAGHFTAYEDDEPLLLERDVWRFFAVEGGGEFSLANHDKYAASGGDGWEARLIAYAENGKLDRQRLLDASLDALERDFGQFRAGWYSRFHVAMAPTPAEISARADRYLRLLGSSVPPTVSFAIKFVQALDKSESLAPDAMLAGLEPALQARSKGTVAAALKLVARAAKRQQALRQDAAASALLALVCEDAGVQGKALDLFETLDGQDNSALRDTLADYVDLVAPSVRDRIAALAGVTPTQSADTITAGDLLAPVPIIPVSSAEEALSLFLTVLENPRDPFEVERATDGLSRFGPALRDDDQRLSPLRKRAKQVWDKRGDSDLREILAVSGYALTEGKSIAEILPPTPTEGVLQHYHLTTLARFHMRRNNEISARILAGAGLPLLSLPSDSSGTVSVADLTTRLAAYHSAGVVPGTADLSLALMRLGDDRPSKPPAPIHETEAGRALAYALGADMPVGPTAELWASAWRARRPVEEDARITALFDTPLPDCGVPIQQNLQVGREHSGHGNYFWVTVAVPPSPELPNEADILPALYAFHPKRQTFNSSNCGATFADIAWASLTMPTDLEPFFGQGILQQNTYDKLNDNPTRAFLEPFFRPGGPIGDLGAGLLAYDMACEDKSVSSLATEAAALALRQKRLSNDQLAAALKAFLMSASLPTTRWTKALAAMAEAGAEGHVRDIIALILDFPADETPRDMGGMLELFYELHVAAGTAPDRPATLACLATIKGGGKVAKFSKKLRIMAAQPA